MAPWNKKSSASVYTHSVQPGKEALRSESRSSGFSTVADFEKKDLVSQHFPTIAQTIANATCRPIRNASESSDSSPAPHP